MYNNLGDAQGWKNGGPFGATMFNNYYLIFDGYGVDRDLSATRFHGLNHFFFGTS